MLPDRVSNPGPLTYESGALPIALRGPACALCTNGGIHGGILVHLTLSDTITSTVTRALDQTEYLVIIRDNFC